MTLDTLIFDPSACGFPKPRIPLLPIGLDGVSLKASAPWAPRANFRHFSRGRYALREAYRLAGIGPDSTLLAPAYHCRTMFDPALALGGNVAFYSLTPNLSPDLATLDALAENTRAPVKALLATHFFGIAQDFTELASWCARRGIVLVEDGSHAFFSQQHRPTGIGQFGAFVVSSPYKFLPSPDGGILYARQAEQLDSLLTRQPAWRTELRYLVHFWQKSAEYRRRYVCNIDQLGAELATIVRHPAPPARDLRINAGCSADYCPDEEQRAAMRYSQMIYRRPDSETVANRRRENYRRWAAATTGLSHCHPLFPNLPADSIPYMFPLHIEKPDPHFYQLKQLGLPIFRWDSIAATHCPTANDYRLHLLHLPCHQSLSNGELEWMIAAIRSVVT